MQYKVLALDLDGTLTNSDKIITPRTKAAIAGGGPKGRLHCAGQRAATVGIEPLAKELELEKYGGYILSYNGGKIIDCPDRPDTGAACLPGGPHRAGLYFQPLLERCAVDLRQKRHRDGGRRRGLCKRGSPH